MKRVILIFILMAVLGCNKTSDSLTVDSSVQTVDSIELLVAQSNDSNKHLDSLTTATVNKTSSNFEKLVQQIEVYKREITKIKSIQKVQTEKIIYIHDTVTIVEKKNLFGKTKKITITKSAADSTLNEDINITTETDSL